MNKNISTDIRKLCHLSEGGSPEICIAILDGAADLSHPSLRGASLERFDCMVQETPDNNGPMSNHATHIVSTIFGQHREDSEVHGWAPRCRGVLIPVFSDRRPGKVPQIDLARAINLALQQGANVINISGGEFVKNTADADQMLKNAIKTCDDNNVLVVAAAGNDGCECLHLPAALPTVLAVGAMDDQGLPMDFSNWGKEYASQGILAPGQNVLGAKAGGGTLSLSGTSFATPLVSAVTALLLSIQRMRGIEASPAKVREALIKSALRCHPQWGSDCQRFLAGSLNIQGAYALLFNGENLMDHTNSDAGRIAAEAPLIEIPHDAKAATGIAPSGAEPAETALPSNGIAQLPPAQGIQPSGTVTASGVAPSAACACQTQNKSLVYALGKIGYDFGSEARRDGFTQLMQGSGNKRPNPYDPRQMLDYLDQRPFEAKMLIWTLNIDLTPVYAIDPAEPFANDTYGLLIGALNGQTVEEDNKQYIERVSIPGYLTGRTVRLYSGQVVPVISAQPRGLYYWNVNHLIDAAISSATESGPGRGSDATALRQSLREFLNRIYYDYRNLGSASSERALNFAATNAFQAADVFAQTLADPHNGSMRQLANIAVEKSPFCRMDSDCWDVKLGFFDPENDRRAMKIVRYTIDVSDVMPVTLGEPKSWAATAF